MSAIRSALLGAVLIASSTMTGCTPSTAPAAQNGGTTAIDRGATARSGILVCATVPTATSSTLSLQWIDPQTGRVTSTLKTKEIYLSPDGHRMVIGRGCLREQFNSDFTRTALVDESVRDDGSRHVGYVDLTTGRVTDVTASGIGPSAGFAAPALPQDDDPLFSPGKEEFVFARGQDVIGVDLKSMARTTRAHRGIDGLGKPFPTNGLVVAPGSGAILASDAIPNPSGTRAVSSDPLDTVDHEQPFPTLLVWDDLSQTLDPNAKGRKIRITNLPETPWGGPYGGMWNLIDCAPAAWIDDSTFICDEGLAALVESQSLQVITLQGGQSEVSGRSLLPTNVRKNSNPVVDPSGTSVAFYSSAPGQASIYRVPASGGTPTKVADLTMDPAGLTAGVLLEWTK